MDRPFTEVVIDGKVTRNSLPVLDWLHTIIIII